MSDDPQFPDRPDHTDFFALSDAVITIDNVLSAQESQEQTVAAMNEQLAKYADIASLDYMAMGRVQAMAAQVGFPLNMMIQQVAPIIAGMWQEGFLTAQLFNERKDGLMTVPDTLEGLDGL